MIFHVKVNNNEKVRTSRKNETKLSTTCQSAIKLARGVSNQHTCNWLKTRIFWLTRFVSYRNIRQPVVKLSLTICEGVNGDNVDFSLVSALRNRKFTCLRKRSYLI